MQYVILGLLLVGPLSLYDVHKHFSGGVAHFYSASYGSLRRALIKLLDAGMIEAQDAPTGARKRTLYSVTPAGRAAWREWMHAPMTGTLNESAILARVFFLDGLPPEERTGVLSTLTERVRAELTELTEVAATVDAQDLPPQLRETFRYRRATLDYGIRSSRLALAWLEEFD